MVAPGRIDAAPGTISLRMGPPRPRAARPSAGGPDARTVDRARGPDAAGRLIRPERVAYASGQRAIADRSVHALLLRPFRATVIGLVHFPRALPWADILPPFRRRCGLKGRNNPAQGNALGIGFQQRAIAL